MAFQSDQRSSQLRRERFPGLSSELKRELRVAWLLRLWASPFVSPRVRAAGVLSCKYSLAQCLSMSFFNTLAAALCHEGS